ncbi:MAG TPA: cytochrome c [Prolixibacteraceae bacterium]
MKKHNLFLILILFSLATISCKYDFVLPEVVAPVSNVSFSQDITPIFEAKCTVCHKTGVQAPDLTAANAYSQIVPAFVNTASPETSVIYINASSGNHAAKVSATQAAKILQWITEGAKNN